MEPFAGYLLRSALWLSGFFLVWIIFLRNERFFTLRRFFLLSGIIASLLLPLVTIRFIVEIPPAAEDSILSADDTSASASVNTLSGDNIVPALSLLYLAVVLLLLLRTLVQSASLFFRVIKKDISIAGKAKVVKSLSAAPSFSFFNYIFINPSLPEEERREILNHEMAHVTQMHWVDLILSQLLCTLQWANPLAWLWARFVKQNHEYLADQSALKLSAHPAVYRAAMINQLIGTPALSLSNSFNQSLNKKRFDMMNNRANSPWRKLKVLFILPVAALILYACSESEYMPYAVTENNPADGKSQHLSDIRVRGIVVDDSGPVERVNVVVTENQKGTVTDREGYFELDAPGTSTLTFSANGYRTRTMSISNLFMGKFYNPSPMVIGVRLDRNDQEPPPQPYRPRVETREPSILFILDGIEMADTDLYELDPKNIERISVLKDESSISHYGDRAKDGVIIITTKKN